MEVRGLRIVVFTEQNHIEASPWWTVLTTTPGLSRILICRQVTSRRITDVLKRLPHNVRTHGLSLIPSQIGALFRRLARRSEPVPPDESVPCDRVQSLDIHDPVTLGTVRDWHPDLGVSLGAPSLERCLFAIPRLGTLNLHLGHLPDFRASPPGFWELYGGALEIEASVHGIDEGWCTGPLILTSRAPIYQRDTLQRVRERASELGTMVLQKALQLVADGDAKREPQIARARADRLPTLRQRARLAGRLAVRQLKLRSWRWLIKQIAAMAFLVIWRPLRDLRRTLTASHPVRVFTFHRVTNLSRDGMTVSPVVFRHQVRYILKTHNVVSLEDALTLVRGLVRLRRPVAVLTFDDGYRSVHQLAQATLAEHTVPACCFVSTEFVGTDERFPHDRGHPAEAHFSVMTWEELAALRRGGWSIGAHSATHRRLADCDRDSLRREIETPLPEIRRRLGMSEVAMAYPFGGPDDITPEGVTLVRAAGYTACLADAGGENWPGTSTFELRRIDLGGDHPTLIWKLWTHGGDFRRHTSGLRRWRRRWPRLDAADSKQSSRVNEGRRKVDLS